MRFTFIPSSENLGYAFRDDGFAAAPQPPRTATMIPGCCCCWSTGRFCFVYSFCTPPVVGRCRPSRCFADADDYSSDLKLQIDTNDCWTVPRSVLAATLMDYWMVVVVVIVIDDHQFVGGCSGDNYVPNGLPCGSTPL